MGNKNDAYTKICDIIRSSEYFKALSDKTEIYTGKHRLITTYSLASIGTRFAKVFGFDKELIELITYARDLGYPPYGELGESVLKKKYAEFSRAECSVQILESIISDYNKSSSTPLQVPTEVKEGILSSFDGGDNSSGGLVAMVEKSYKAGKMNNNFEKTVDENMKNEAINDIDYLWHKKMEGIEITNKTISENILKFAETSIKKLE
jgi:dGTP triphosphohydrolase